MKKIKRYNTFKEILIDKLTESNINLDDDDGFDGYLIYTYGMNDEDLLEIYKLLFLNYYKLPPYISRIEDLTVSNYNKTFLFLLKLEKKILSSTRYFRNNYTDICNFLANCGYDDKYYMFKDYNELKRVFKPLKLNDYFNNRKNIYESLLDEMRGPNEEEVFNSLKELSPKGILLRSCKINFIPGVKLAYERQPNLSQTQEYEAIANCCIYGSLDVLKYLIEHEGLNPEIKNNKCVKYAIENGNIEIVKYYIDNKYLTQKNDDTFLFRAIIYYKFDIMKLLLFNGWVVTERLLDDIKRNKTIKKDLGSVDFNKIILYLIKFKNNHIY